MKKTFIMTFAVLITVTAAFAQFKQDSTRKHPHHHSLAKKYTCSMHHEIVNNNPGKCPKCGMVLVLTKKINKTSKEKIKM